MGSLISGLLNISSKLDPTGVTGKLLGTNQPAPTTATTVVTPAPPTTATTDQSANVQSQMDELAKRQGRAANLLTSTSGVSNTPTGTKTLLGQ